MIKVPKREPIPIHRAASFWRLYFWRLYFWRPYLGGGAKGSWTSDLKSSQKVGPLGCPSCHTIISKLIFPINISWKPPSPLAAHAHFIIFWVKMSKWGCLAPGVTQGQFCKFNQCGFLIQTGPKHFLHSKHFRPLKMFAKFLSKYAIHWYLSNKLKISSEFQGRLFFAFLCLFCLH